MKYTGAAFFDYDGTLVDERQNIFSPTEETQNAMKKLKEKGYLICLSTARSLSYVPHSCIEFDGYIAANGAYASVGQEIFLNLTFKKELYEKAMLEFGKRELQYSFENQQCFYANDTEGDKYLKMLEIFGISKDNLRSLDKMDFSTINKALVTFNTDSEFDELKSVFNGELVFERHRMHYSADVSMYGINKGTGVKSILDKLDIPFSNTYAFGDSINDVEMLNNVCHGVAMGISSAEVQNAAEFITKNVAEDGVSFALRHYGIL